jgi:integrative and conjugative element protein (TIGR02256 family)
MKKNNVRITAGSWLHTFIKAEAQLWYPLETGGILIGNWLNENEVIITKVVGPGPKAVHLPFSFTPDNEYHIAEIAKYFKESDGHETYLGDWHTHPAQPSYLSKLDIQTLRKIARFKPAQQSKPLMLVMGTHPFDLKAFIFKDTSIISNGHIKQCQLITNWV